MPLWSDVFGKRLSDRRWCRRAVDDETFSATRPRAARKHSPAYGWLQTECGIFNVYTGHVTEQYAADAPVVGPMPAHVLKSSAAVDLSKEGAGHSWEWAARHAFGVQMRVTGSLSRGELELRRSQLTQGRDKAFGMR